MRSYSGLKPIVRKTLPIRELLNSLLILESLFRLSQRMGILLLLKLTPIMLLTRLTHIEMPIGMNP